MGKALFVIGSDTDVGKSFVTAGLTYVMNKTHKAIPYKPIQSGGVYVDGQLKSMDIDFVKRVCQLEEDDQTMNTYCFEAAVSPHIASEKEGVTIDFDRIVDHYKALKSRYDYTLVEGAGGVVVPLSREVYIYDLVKKMDLGVVLVTRAGVGTINHTCLTVAYLRQVGIEIKAIVVNGYKGTYYEADNVKIIKEVTGIEAVITLDHVSDMARLKETYDRCLKKDRIETWFV